jgi:dTDP-4-amino-4,6-dideoxygalactose transaminase
VWHIFPILCEQRDRLQQYLADHGVGTVIHYPIPPHKQACYSVWHEQSFPITERIHSQELSLPCHQAMSDSDVDYVIQLINNFA